MRGGGPNDRRDPATPDEARPQRFRAIIGSLAPEFAQFPGVVAGWRSPSLARQAPPHHMQGCAVQLDALTERRRHVGASFVHVASSGGYEYA